MPCFGGTVLNGYYGVVWPQWWYYMLSAQGPWGVQGGPHPGAESEGLPLPGQEHPHLETQCVKGRQS